MMKKLYLALTISTLLGLAAPPAAAQAQELQEKQAEFPWSTVDPRHREYFQAMGIDSHRFRRVTALGTNRQRLEYSLFSKSPFSIAERKAELGELTLLPKGSVPEQDDSLGLGRIGFNERWLLVHLNKTLPQLDDLEIIDVARGRTRGGPPLTSLERSILVTGPTEAVQQAERLLDQYSEMSHRMVEFDCRVYVWEADDSAEAVSVEVLDEAQFKLRRRAADQGAKLLGHQFLVATSTQPAHFASLEQVAYVQDFKLESIPGTEGPALIADPIIGVTSDGIAMNLTPLLDPDGETLHLSASVEQAKLRRPIATFETSIGTGNPVTIQLPEISKVRWASEELSLGPDDYGFQVKRLQYFDWDEDGKALPRALEVLIRTRVIRPEPSVVVGEVIGSDPATRLAFARRSSAEELPKGSTFVFYREGKRIGEARLVEEQGQFLVIRWEEDEPRAGDEVRR